MDVVIIFNGLGNQMSQYAFYLSKYNLSPSTRFVFSKKSNKIHNGYELEKVFGIKYRDSMMNKLLFSIYKILDYKKFPVISKPFIRLLGFFGLEIINENDDYQFKPAYLLPSKGIKFYAGGWPSEKYFTHIKQKVQNTFQFDTENIGKENREVLNQLKKTASVSVHIRRGDFLAPINYEKFGVVCTKNYYVTAIEMMKERVKDPHFFFFTNDFNWVSAHFIGDNYTIININKSGDSWKDMFLISNCTHHINSNGTFSWWSSWLTDHNNAIVIVPKNFIAGKYFEDVYPENWIKLSDY